METPVTDESGNPVLKKGKPQPDKAKSATEIIPLSENIDEYFAKNVLPYNSIIFAEFKALTAKEADLMKEILGE